MTTTWAAKVGYPTNKPVRIPHKKIAAAIDELIREVKERAGRVAEIRRMGNDGEWEYESVPVAQGGIPHAYLCGQYDELTRRAYRRIHAHEYQELANQIIFDLGLSLVRPSSWNVTAFQEFPSLYYALQRGKRAAMDRVLTILERYIPTLSVPSDFLPIKPTTPERTEPHDCLEYNQAKRIARKLAARSGKKRYTFNTPFGYQVSSTAPTEHNGYVIAKPNGDFIHIRPDWQYPYDKNRVEYVEHPRHTKVGW